MLAEVVVLVEVVVMVVVVDMLVLLEEEVVVMVVVDAATAAAAVVVVVVDVVVELLLLLRLEGAVVMLMLSFGNKVETGDDWGRPDDFLTVREDEMLFLFALTRGGIMDGRTEFDKFCVHVTLSNVSGVNCCTLETV